MATIIAHQDFDSRGIDLYESIANQTDLDLFLDANTPSPEGALYEDAVRIGYDADGEAYYAFFAGTGFTFNFVTQAVTGGTVTGIWQTVESGQFAGADFSIEGLSLSAVDVYTAFTTSDTADDEALIATALSGDDAISLLAASADYADGFAGNDTMSGAGGNDTLVGGAGNDSLTGGTGADQLVGGAGNDSYVATAIDTLVEDAGGGAADRISTSGNWTLALNFERLQLTGTTAVNGIGNGAANRLAGNGIANLLDGKGGKDVLAGAGGNDTLLGGNSIDTLRGQLGDDELHGGLANDVLTGAAGADRFVFDSALGATPNIDLITDLDAAVDTIVLDDDVFGAFNAGVSTQLTAGDIGTRIIYNGGTGALLYDADGAGGSAAVQFATLGASVHPALTTPDLLGLFEITG